MLELRGGQMSAALKSDTPAAALIAAAPAAGAAPARVFDMDRRRVERALRQRVRYRYVRPMVVREVDGWRIVSPCCSRNIDAQGGLIDIAWLRSEPPIWRLYARDHAHGIWVEHERSGQLLELLDVICLDPQRVFWP